MQKNNFRERTGQIIMNTIVFFSRKNPYFVAFLFSLLVGVIYFSCAVRITHNVFAPTSVAYYNYLLDAFFHGRTNITSPELADLSLFQNKWYAYWGPAPVLLILPFYLVSHLQASDVIYTAIGGIVNVALFSCVMQEFKKYFRISLSLIAEAFLVLSFGLASPNFFLATAGKIWFTDQIFSITYLLLFYLFCFRFLNSEKPSQLILCMVFFCLACLSKYTLLFNGILFLYLFLHCKMSGRAIPTKIIPYLALFMLAFISLEALYNFLRFHDILETGLDFQVGRGGQFNIGLKNKHILSVSYISTNVYYCFINIIHFSSNNLSVIIDLRGNSVFSVYPALLLVPVLFWKRKYVDKKRISFLILAGIVIGLNILALMLYFATGESQFGYRYFLDVLPLIFLLIIFILPSIPIFIQMGLLAYGVFINLYGIMAFYNIFPSFQETLFWIVLFTSVVSFGYCILV